MRALRYSAFGPAAQVLRSEELPEPQPGAHEVVVRARFAGINPLDWKLVEGQFKLLAKSRPPCGVGAEFAGEVLRVGTQVRAVRPGDRVVAWLNPFAEPPRALAEQVCVVEKQCVRIPDEVSFDVAAVTPVAGLSALQLCNQVHARAGQRVLVHGAAGGVGSLVVPMLRERGATVVATGSAASQAFLRTLGADAQVDYAAPATSWPGPFDAIIDCASKLDRAVVPMLMPAGGDVAVTLPSFPSVIFDPLLNPLRRIRWHTLRLEPNASELAQVLAQIAAGKLTVRLTRTYPFDAAVEALAESRGGHVRGKIAVAIS
ncbi:MAG TPA: NADP-dependent oxidoreductase [Burkholderiaceae bacterium]|nr:NADP-dependent oxidoreductase [Burkholderiaceae bacterium]HQR77033.1 NADP-dependent oxidoreductase [Burkholderiaceae bacterium]